MFAPIFFLCLSTPAVASNLHFLRDTYIGHDFLDTSRWEWETLDDPTHGRVNYVNQSTAIALNLTEADDKTFLMRGDDVRMVSPAERGRNSVRISSFAAYSDSVIVLDLLHIPTGCATWPAFWTLSKAGPWPRGGEIDIIEGVNNNTNNLASLHTTENCNMTQTRDHWQSGTTVSTQCDVKYNYNQGCGVSFKPKSYGEPFNSNGGGWYVMSRGSYGIFVWFWPRDSCSVPIEVSQGFSAIDPNPFLWGQPDAAFPTDNCDYESHFDPHRIVFDLTFCGDWAGSDSVYSGCPGKCVDFVNNNPSAFSEAYWKINSLRVYTPVL
ncbi:glycoside hydrolase family 16 protein [Mycena olivaceomarginata]|nr:glycoside hydrolase family 16 protein [Mycena olivaceomarginata]